LPFQLSPCGLTYGGVSLFVVIFAVIPIARPLFKELDLPWHLFMAAFIFGAASLSMTMLPGTPQIQNIMPTKYMASSPTSAPLVGLTGAFIVATFNVFYFRYILKKAKAKGERYEETRSRRPRSRSAGLGTDAECVVEPDSAVVVLILLNVDIPYIKKDVVLALTGGVVACMILFWKVLCQCP